MKPFIEPTKGQTPPMWADIDWHAVETNVGRLARAESTALPRTGLDEGQEPSEAPRPGHVTKLLAIRRVTQENQGKNTAGVDGWYVTPRSPAGTVSRRPRLKDTDPCRSDGFTSPKDKRQAKALGIPMRHSYCTSLQRGLGD